MSGFDGDRDAVLAQLERVLASATFRQAERSAGLLRYLVERGLRDSGDRVKEYTVGVEALGRAKGFDPRTDPIVRAEVSRLRGRLERYYSGEGVADPLIIELPKGTYAPRFLARDSEEPAPIAADERAAAPAMPPVPAVPAVPAVSVALAPSRRRLGFALGGVTLLAAAFLSGRWSATPPAAPPEPPTRVDIRLQVDERIASEVGTSVVIAPDGGAAVFVSLDSIGTPHLRFRRFDGSPPVDLPGTSGGRSPFWSPDGRWIGFWSGGQLLKLAVDGGEPVVLCSAPTLSGASWGENGTIIVALDATSRLFRVDANEGGTPTPVVDLSPDRAAPAWPQLLPGGTHVLYTALTPNGLDQARVEIAALADGSRREVVKGATFGRFVAPGHLTYINQGTLYALRFDPVRGVTSGAPVPILDDLAYSATFGYGEISFTRSGDALYRRSVASGPAIVARIDSAGAQVNIVGTPGRYGWPALSPDGRRLALETLSSGVSALTILTDLDARPRVEWSKPAHNAPLWTGDGRFLLARASEGIVSLSAAGGDPRTVIAIRSVAVPWSFGPAERELAYAVVDSATAFDLWMAPLERSGDVIRAGPPRPLVRTPFFETYPAISPDGRWLAYVTYADGPPEIVVRSRADSSVRVSVARGGRVPRWSRSGRRLHFVTNDRRLMSVTYRVEAGRFVPDRPRQWTPLRLADTGVLPNYNVGVDDASVIALLPQEQPDGQAANHVTLLRRFPEELRRRVP